MSEFDHAEILRRFTYHPPTGNQAEAYELLRTTGREFAKQIVALTPSSREQSLAVTYLEQAVMFANAAIARRSETEMSD